MPPEERRGIREPRCADEGRTAGAGVRVPLGPLATFGVALACFRLREHDRF